jgi:threonine synthase
MQYKSDMYTHTMKGVYDDEDNFVEEYCTNEDTATDVYKLIRKAHREKQSYYYRRRTSELASEDKEDIVLGQTATRTRETT